MTNYNDGKWHGWNGGECPVHENTVVECVYDDGYKFPSRKTQQSSGFCWGPVSTIIAFRVIKEHKEPREFHAKVKCTWTFMEGMEGEPVEYWEFCKSTDPEAVLFREVLK